MRDLLDYGKFQSNLHRTLKKRDPFSCCVKVVGIYELKLEMLVAFEADLIHFSDSSFLAQVTLCNDLSLFPLELLSSATYSGLTIYLGPFLPECNTFC